MKNNSTMFPLFIKYTFLNVLGMIGLSCYILADTFYVARALGANGLTALNLAIPIYSFIHGCGLMVGMGGATRYSLMKGQTKQQNTDSIFTHSIQLSFAISACFFLLGALFSGSISTLLGADSTTFGMASTYLKVILMFAPLFMLNNVILCFVRNDGNPKLSMSAMLIGSFSNILLDYVFMFPLQMGMFGAALATGMAPAISLLILSLHFIYRKNHMKPVKTIPSFTDLKNIISLGTSSLVVEMSSGIVMITFNTVILSIQGNIGVAAYGIIANLSLVVLSIFTGISQGVQPLVSTNYGSGSLPNVKKVFHYALTTGILFAVIIYIITYVFATPIAGIFNKEHNPLLSSIAVEGMHIYFIAFLFVAVNTITAGFFSSCDKPGAAFLISILRGFVIILPTTFLLSKLCGLRGVWLAFPVAELLTAMIAVLLLFRFTRTAR